MEVNFELQLVDREVTLTVLAHRAQATFGDMVKAVVDIDRKIMTIVTGLINE